MPHADNSASMSDETKPLERTSNRSGWRHTGNAAIGVALCYGVLFLAAELNSADVANPSPEAVPELAVAETRDNGRLTADAGPDADSANLDSGLVTAGLENPAARLAATPMVHGERFRQAQAFDEQRLRTLRYRQALDAARNDTATVEAASMKAAAVSTASISGLNRDLDAERQRVQALQSRFAAQDQAGRRQLQDIAEQRDAALKDLDAARASVSRVEEALQLAGRRNAETERKAQTVQRKLEQSLQMVLVNQDARQKDAQKLSALEQDLRAAHTEVQRLEDRLEQSIRAAVVDRRTLQRETERALGLARDLQAARAQIQRLGLRGSKKLVRAEPAAKAAVPGKGAARVQRRPETMKTSTGRVARTADFLPTSLLPTRPPLRN